MKSEELGILDPWLYRGASKTGVLYRRLLSTDNPTVFDLLAHMPVEAIRRDLVCRVADLKPDRKGEDVTVISPSPNTFDLTDRGRLGRCSRATTPESSPLCFSAILAG